jgi:hypothetical protein
MELIDVAYLNPLKLGLHHHVQKMELKKQQQKQLEQVK